MPPVRSYRAVLVAAAGLLLAPLPAARAASPGVNIAGPPTPQLVQEVIASGAKSVRIFALWRDLEPDARGQYPPNGNSPYGLQQLSGVYDAGLQALNAAGVKPLYVLVETPQWANGTSDFYVPPTNAADFGAFAGRFAAHNKALGGQVLGYEIWNEADAGDFWHTAPDPVKYTAMLKASYTAIKAADPNAVVVTGPTTGNNAAWMRQLYGAGAGGFFDAVAVHTDTACLVRPPDEYYRDESGDIGQFSFLGYRVVHKVMTENGDGDKPIFMSELGWSSTNGGPTSCARGSVAGQRPDGVSEAVQAANLTLAFGCLANDSYVTNALWFTLHDTTNQPLAELNSYGLFRSNGSKKASYDAFKAVAAKNGGEAAYCGDFEPPSLQVVKPAPGEQFVDMIDIVAMAADQGVGVSRVVYTFDGGQKIRPFAASAGQDFSQQVRQAPWYGAKNLSIGPHTIEIAAIDANGNTTTKTVPVVKVASFAATLLPEFVVKKSQAPRCRKNVCAFSAQLKRGASGSPTIGGHVAVEWQYFNKKKQWRKLSGGRAQARKPFTFRARLNHKGKWRVRVLYLGQAPWKPTQTPFVYFTL